MSDWRLDLQELARMGGTATTAEWGTYNGCRSLKEYGLATSEKVGHHYRYTLTPLGWDVVEGRVRRDHCGPSPAVFRATWLRALPRAGEIRLA